MAPRNRRDNALTKHAPDYPDTYEDENSPIGVQNPEYRPVGGRGFEPTGMYSPVRYYRAKWEAGNSGPVFTEEEGIQRGLDKMDDAALAARGLKRLRFRQPLDMRDPDAPLNPNDPGQSDPFGGTEDNPGRAFDELTPEEQRMLLNRGRSVWEPRVHYPERDDEGVGFPNAPTRRGGNR